MPQRPFYTVISTKVADEAVWDDEFEGDLEAEPGLDTFTVRGASTEFLNTAPPSAKIATDMVVGEITLDTDADAGVNVANINGLLDGGIDAVVTSLDVDGGTTPAYEQFQNITLPFRAVMGTERFLVTAVADGASEDTWTVIRGIDGTTAAVHSDGAAMIHYVGPEANIIGVTDESLFAVGDVFKVETGGVERILVTAKDAVNDVITISRGVWGSVIDAVIAQSADLFDVVNDAQAEALIVGANADLRVLGAANKYPEGDEGDHRVALAASDYA